LAFGIGLRQAASRFLDASPKYWYVDIDSKPVGPCGRRQCDLGVDGGEDGRLCTDILVGTPQWSTVAGDLVLEPGFQGNPYFARVQSGSGRARVCSERLPRACGEIVVP
jgi:hypothetical protein